MNAPHRQRKAGSSWAFHLGFLVVLSVGLGFLADLLIYNVADKEYRLFSPKPYVISGLFTTAYFLVFRGMDRLLQRYVVPNSARNNGIYVGTTSLAMLGVFLIGMYVMEWVLAEMDHGMWGSPVFNVAAGVSLLGCVTTVATYYGRSFYLRYLEMEKAQHESQMAALKAQINPHFLFNALNSIAALIRVDPRKAERVTEDLADLFRYSLRSSKTETNTLEEEMDAVRTYLAIERARFGDRLQVHIDVGADLDTILVPGLIVQPLLENSIKHGASQTIDPFTIDLTIRKNGRRLTVSVTDNGPGFGDRPLPDILQNGTGLRNIRDRLDLMYGNQADLSATGRTVRLDLPVSYSNPRSMRTKRIAWFPR